MHSSTQDVRESSQRGVLTRNWKGPIKTGWAETDKGQPGKPTICPKIITEMRGADLLFFELIKTVKFAIQCVFFELIKTVQGINFLQRNLSTITDIVLVFFEPSSPHNSQRIDGNQQHNEDNTYCHIITHAHTTKHNQKQTQPNTNKHITHFQHRYRPTSFQVARGLQSHTRTVVSCMMRTCSPDKE